jgi:ankyrin repeat protein
MIAARNGNQELVWSLIRRKASATKRSQVGDTALMMASLRGDREIARMLMSSAAAEVKHSGWRPSTMQRSKTVPR